MTAPFPAALRRALPTVFFFFFLAAEFIFFDQVGARHYTAIYPRWHEQIQYLSESYSGYLYSHAHGWRAGLWQALVNPSAHGTMQNFFAVTIFDVVGPSRSAALSVNLLALLAWQGVLYLHVLRRTRSLACAWIGVALVLAARSAWISGPGSAFDFRLDWLTTCLMGCTVIATVETKGFRSTAGSSLFGFCVGLTLLTRFLTGAYFIVAFVALGGWLLLGVEPIKRFAHLLLSAAIAGAMAVPIFWLNRERIYHHYLVVPVPGPESALQAPHWGVGQSASWLVSNFSTQQVGAFAFWLFLGALSALVAGLLLAAKSPADPEFRVVPPGPSLVPLVTFLTVPAAILILHNQKSPAVLGIMLPAALMLLLEPLLRLGQAVSRPWVNRVAGAVVGVSLLGFALRLGPSPYDQKFLASAQRVNQFADLIVERSRMAHLEEPRIAVDRVCDFLEGPTLRVLCYERQKRWIPFRTLLPIGLAEQSDDEIFKRICQSDFLVLTERGPPGPWPSDAQMDRLRPRISAWAQTHLKAIDHLAAFDLEFQVYAPEVTALPVGPSKK